MKSIIVIFLLTLFLCAILSSCSKSDSNSNSGLKTDITFNNPVFSNIIVALNGSVQTVPPGGSVTYNAVSGKSATISGYTYGEPTPGHQAGLKMTWNSTLTLTGGTVSVNLNVPSDYFFLYITDSGVHNLTGLTVNYGLSDQTFDSLVIDANSVKYGVGYYKAHSNTTLRMTVQDQPNIYVNASNLNFAWTDNQTISINFGYKSAGKVSSDITGYFDITIAKSSHSVKCQSTVNLFCN